MHVTLELVWDAAAGRFVGSWNGKRVELPDEELAGLEGSAVRVEARYGAGGLKDVKIEGVTRHPRLVLASALFDPEPQYGRNQVDAALDELAHVAEEVVARDPEMRSFRACARAAAGQMEPARRDLAALLGRSRLETFCLHLCADAIERLPPEMARELLPALCAHLDGSDSGLAVVRGLPDAVWTRDSILAVIASRPSIGKHPWLLQELVDQARRLGLGDHEITAAMGDQSAALASHGETSARRQRLAEEHLRCCQSAIGDPHAIDRMVAIMRREDAAATERLEAALAGSNEYLDEEERAEVVAEMSLDLAEPASAELLAQLDGAVRSMGGGAVPSDFVRFLQLANGASFSWTDVVLRGIDEILQAAREIEATGPTWPDGVPRAVLPFLADDHGLEVALVIAPDGHAAVHEIEKRSLILHPVAPTFSEWLCWFVGNVMSPHFHRPSD